MLLGLVPCRVAVWAPGPAWPHPRAVRGPAGCAPCGGGPGCLPPRVLLVLDEVDECPAFAVDGALVAHDDAGHPVGVRVPVGALFRVDVVALGGDLVAGAGAVCVAVVVTAAGCRRWGGAISDLSNFSRAWPRPSTPLLAARACFRAFWPLQGDIPHPGPANGLYGLSGQKSAGAGPGSAYDERWSLWRAGG